MIVHFFENNIFLKSTWFSQTRLFWRRRRREREGDRNENAKREIHKIDVDVYFDKLELFSWRLRKFIARYFDMCVYILLQSFVRASHRKHFIRQGALIFRRVQNDLSDQFRAFCIRWMCVCDEEKWAFSFVKEHLPHTLLWASRSKTCNYMHVSFFLFW